MAHVSKNVDVGLFWSSSEYQGYFKPGRSSLREEWGKDQGCWWLRGEREGKSWEDGDSLECIILRL